MGLPIKHRKKYVSHKKRWDKKTIVDEAVLVNDYALKNKNEIRKVELEISKYKGQAKTLNRNIQTKESEQAKHFIEKLKTQGILNPEATSLDEVLDIKLRNVLERRLSNIVYKLKLARTPKQARQFIVHKHVMVGGQLVTSPSYSVSLAEENTVVFIDNSSLADENHPERKIEVHGLEEAALEMSAIPSKQKDFAKAEAAVEEEEADEVAE